MNVNLKAKPFYLNDSQIAWVNENLQKMTVEEKIGQLFFMMTATADDSFIDMLANKYHAGGIMGRPMSLDNACDFAKKAQGRAKIPLFISANLEAGGDGLIVEGTNVGPNLEIAATGDSSYAGKQGMVCAKEAIAAGANLAFAPVVDIEKNFRNPIMNKIMEHCRIQGSALEASGEALGSIFGIFYFTTFLKVPLVGGAYTYSVIPVIVMIALAAQVQKLAKKIIPELVQNFFVLFFVAVVTIPIGLLVIGPIVSLLTQAVSAGATGLYNLSPVIFGVFEGFLWQVLVMFGLHWAVMPLGLINLEKLGYDTIGTGTFGNAFATVGVVLGMYFKMKDKKQKNLCIPAAISGVCGITEPAIYGLTLPKKKPFFIAMIASGVTGGLFCFLGGKGYTSGGMGIFSIWSYCCMVVVH